MEDSNRQLLELHSLSSGAAKRPQFLNERWYLYKDIRRSVTEAEKLILAELEGSLRAEAEQSGKSSRLRRKAYERTLRVLLANLWNTHLHGRELIIPASSHRKGKQVYHGYSPAVRDVFIEFLKRRDYIVYSPGEANSFAGIASWCVAAPKLLALIESCETKIVVQHRSPPVILRGTKAKGAKSAPEIELIGRNLRQARKEGRVAEKMNQLLEDSLIIYPLTKTHAVAKYRTIARRQSPQFPVTLTRIFNNSSWQMGGRYYGDHQNTPSAIRRHFLINGEPVVELDYAALHARIVYAEAGVQFPLDKDPYGPKGSKLRKVNKLIMLRLFNVTDEASLKRCITKSGNPEVAKTYREYKREYIAYSRGRRTEPKKPHSLKSYIAGMPPGTKGSEALADLYRDHPVIESRLKGADGSLGLYLQYKDSEIMTRVLSALVDEQVPALPVHDSVIVPASKKELARQVMQDAFMAVYPGISIPVDEK